MSLIYGRQTENRTNYFEVFLRAEFTKPALLRFTVFAAMVIWHAAANIADYASQSAQG
jgi:hypothetical protein